MSGPNASPTLISASIFVGDLETARLRLARDQVELNQPSMARIKGELAFAEGRLGDAIAALELAQVSDKTAFQITLSLAEAWEARGDDAKAVQLLEDASRYRIQSLAYRFAGGYKWLQVRARLAVLYRKIGRIRDADVIENELRQLLVVADDEHPIQRRLQVRAR